MNNRKKMAAENFQPPLAYALAYADRGLYVFPVHVPLFSEERTGCTCEAFYRSERCKNHPKLKVSRKYDPNYECQSPGKCPSVNWSEKSTNDPEQIRKWWGHKWTSTTADGETVRYIPNIGIDCGRSNLLAFDADTYKEVFGDLFDLLSFEDQQTPTSKTGGGGLHLLYHLGDKPYGNSTHGLPDGIDIRGRGGYIIVPPSIHKSGKQYTWDEDYKLSTIPLKCIPTELDQLLESAHGTHWVNGDDVLTGDEMATQVALIERVTDGLDISPPVPYLDGGLKWIFETCPFNPEDDPHAEDGASYVLLLPDGRIAAGCSHNRCSEGNWQTLREMAGMPVENPITNDAESPEAGLIQITPLAPPPRVAKPLYKRSIIQRNARQLLDLTDESIAMLERANTFHAPEPVCYLRHGSVVRVIQDEIGTWHIDEYTRDSMVQLLAAECSWVTVRAGKEDNSTVTDSSPPPALATNILSTPNLPFPPLRAVVHSPRFARDGSIHTASGYDPGTRMFYGGKFDIGDTSDVTHAKGLIEKMLCDFPFVDAASKAHAYALLLTPFVRDMIDGTTPLFVINASTPGTGKTLLANVLSYPSAGRWIPANTLPESEDEVRKKITGFILAGVDHVLLDNITHHLHSESLNIVATGREWQDRKLGSNTQVTGEIRAVFTLTGNNVSIHDESLRRTIWINLNAMMERPEERDDFQISSIHAWVDEHAEQLVTACLTLVNAWVNAGMPRGHGKRGSYEEWTAIIGGILDVLGIDGFLANTDTVRRENSGSELDAMREFVSAWVGRFGTRQASTSDLFKLAAESPHGDLEYRGLLKDFLRGKDTAGLRRSFGRKLSSYKDRVFGIDGCRYQITFNKRSGGETWYSIVTIGESPEVIEASLSELGL